MQVPDKNSYKLEDYTCGTLTKEYYENAVVYLQSKYPEATKEYIDSFLKDVLKDKLKSPKFNYIHYPKFGQEDLKQGDLLTCFNNRPDNVIAPNGTLFEKANKKPSSMRTLIMGKMKERDENKQKMFEAKAIGDKLNETKYNNIQNKKKIFNNAISGVCKSSFSFLYDPALYAAITGSCRYQCKLGYGHLERLLESNFHFTCIDSVYNWIVLCIRACPTKEEVEAIQKQFKLQSPNIDDLLNHFIVNMSQYTNKYKKYQLQQYLERLPAYQRCFIFYVYNLKNIFQYNDEIYRKWLNHFFNTPKVDETIDPNDIKKIDKDLIIMVLHMNSGILEGYKLHDTITEKPEITKKIITYCRDIENKFNKIQPLFDMFLFPKLTTPRANKLNHIMRKSTVRSDTDSAIFSTVNWNKWWCNGKVTFDKNADQINAFVVYVLSRSLIHIFAISCTNLGMETEDLDMIVMKNEYYYQVLMGLNVGKHYIGEIFMQEGIPLPEPKLDIKGVQLKGSTQNKETLTRLRKFMLNDIIGKYISDGVVHAEDLIREVLLYEDEMRQVILKGDPKYFKKTTVKIKSAYKKPDSSVYASYELWEHVYGKKYGHIVIPEKVQSIPIITLNKKYIENNPQLREIDREFYDGLKSYFEKNPKKIIKKFITPIGLELPPGLKEVVDLRKILFSNVRSFLKVLEAVGISTIYQIGSNTKEILLSDTYRLR